jgi:hypothetical protein
LQLLVDKEQGKTVDEQCFEAQVQHDLAFVLRKQVEVGVDIPSDGELPRLGFSFYVKDRMSGFGGQSQRGTITDKDISFSLTRPIWRLSGNFLTDKLTVCYAAFFAVTGAITRRPTRNASISSGFPIETRNQFFIDGNWRPTKILR